MTIKLYEVGGCVRDRLLGLKSKDIDYSVEVDTAGDWDGEISTDIAFSKMRQFLTDRQFEIFVESPQFFTIRARFPKSRETADFVLCRKEGPYSDGRRPDWVRVGTLADDLDRRDFTVNALAVPVDASGHQIGDIIDRHDGLWDLKIKRLRFVGDPIGRLREDALRIMRALRFVITKDFNPDDGIIEAFGDSDELPKLLAAISVERRREELERCLAHDTMKTLEWVMDMLSDEMREAMFSGGLRLSATLKRGIVRV